MMYNQEDTMKDSVIKAQDFRKVYGDLVAVDSISFEVRRGEILGLQRPSTRAVVLWSQLIFLPSMLISGLTLPYSMLPDVLGKVDYCYRPLTL